MLCRGLLVELWLGRLLRGRNSYEFHEEIKPHLLS
jgi:hypothetical protein